LRTHPAEKVADRLGYYADDGLASTIDEPNNGTGDVRRVSDEIATNPAAIAEAANRGCGQLGHGLAGDDPGGVEAFLHALLSAHAFLSPENEVVCPPPLLTTDAEETGGYDGDCRSQELKWEQGP
jgi:hypothetical protein